MVQIEKEIAQALLNYAWQAERDDFQSDFDIEEDINILSLAECIKWIEWCENEAETTDHIFYSLLQLQRGIFEAN